MSDLVEFLRARLDAEEAHARAAVEEDDLTLRAFDSETEWGWEIASSHHLAEFYVGPQGLAEHIARHDPARVLAEVDAKRRIIDDHKQGPRWNDKPDPVICYRCGDPPGYDYGYMDSPCPTLRLLALPYADRPDYRDEWRPA
jgi:Family of unknown function (DUF6221)